MKKFQIRINFEAKDLPSAQEFHRAFLNQDIVHHCIAASDVSRVTVILGKISVKELRDAFEARIGIQPGEARPKSSPVFDGTETVLEEDESPTSPAPL